MTIEVFHLAFPSHDLESTVRFYSSLGCAMGRRNRSAVTFDFFGHQIVAHLVKVTPSQSGIYPSHFGLIVDRMHMDEIEARLASAKVLYQRRTRFPMSAICHETLLCRDPSGNQLEFKHYLRAGAALEPSVDDRVGDT